MYERKLNRILDKWLFKGKAIILTGARQVGKTTLLKNYFSQKDNVLWLNADESIVRTRLEEESVSSLRQLIGSYQVIIIDEVQRIRNAGLILKLITDNFKETQLIATGSSSIEIGSNIFEPLTGRHLLFHLYPMSFSELYQPKSSFDAEKLLPFHLIYGSYPDICVHREEAEIYLKNLTNQYLYKDILMWQKIRKPDLLDNLLRLLAYQVGSEVSHHELSKKLKIKSETVENYIDLLEKSFVIFRLNAFSNHPRKEVTKMSKIYFWDNGVRNTLINDFEDLSLRNDVGQLWENYIISERLKMLGYNNSNRKTWFWRNYNQSEVDYLETKNNFIHAYEIKWNHKKTHKISRAFTNQYPQSENEIITPRRFLKFVTEP
ncbi:MAG: ATP-binding protein [Crocinitomicaceae bacterium]